MSMNRREFIQTASLAALGTAITSKVSGIPQAAATPAGAFEINQAGKNGNNA